MLYFPLFLSTLLRQTPRTASQTPDSRSSVSLISPYSHACTKMFPLLNQETLLKEAVTWAALTQEEGTALIWTDSPWQSRSWCHTEWEYPCIAAKLELWSLLSFSFSILYSFSHRLSVHTRKWDQSQVKQTEPENSRKCSQMPYSQLISKRPFFRKSFDIGWKRWWISITDDIPGVDG